MKSLVNLKNRITEQYRKAPGIFSYVGRFVLSFLALMLLKSSIGFNDLLSSIFFVIGFSAVCAFVPTRLMTLLFAVYAVVQVFSLSPGLGLLTGILFIIMYLVYFRFDEKQGFVIVLIPLLCMIRLPILIPLVLSVIATTQYAICLIFGFVCYYYFHYLHSSTAVFQAMTENSEITKMSIAIRELGMNRELWITLLCVLIAFFAAYFLKKININKSNQLAICLGAGLYLVLILGVNLIIGSITSSRLIWYVAGTVVSCILAILITEVVLPLDFSRTELLEFEDEEYKYFVRAVPKAYISRESVKIQRIYSRKRQEQSKDREKKE